MSETEQEAPAEEWVTIGEAAARLGLEESTLRRFVKRPKNIGNFIGRTQTQARETRTGTRAATVYPLALLADVWAASRLDTADSQGEDATDQNGGVTSAETPDATAAEREHDTGNVGTNTGNAGVSDDSGNAGTEQGTMFVADQLTRAYLQMMTQELRERVKEQADTIADLRADKARLIAKVDELEAIAPVVAVAAAEIQKPPIERTSGPESGDTAPGHEAAGSGQEQGQDNISREIIQETVPVPRRWWEFWKDSK